MNLNDLALDCNEVSRSKGWLEEKRTFGDIIALSHSELSEALEEFRKGKGFNEIYWKCENCGNEDYTEFPGFSVLCKHDDWVVCSFKPEGIPIELADTIIRILQTCGNENIDIQKGYDVKMAFNMTRPHKHGGKKI